LQIGSDRWDTGCLGKVVGREGKNGKQDGVGARDGRLAVPQILIKQRSRDIQKPSHHSDGVPATLEPPLARLAFYHLARISAGRAEFHAGRPDLRRVTLVCGQPHGVSGRHEPAAESYVWLNVTSRPNREQSDVHRIIFSHRR
jgi:hypothetical protein